MGGKIGIFIGGLIIGAILMGMVVWALMPKMMLTVHESKLGHEETVSAIKKSAID